MAHKSNSRRQFLKTSVVGGLGVAAGLSVSRAARAQNAPPATAPAAARGAGRGAAGRGGAGRGTPSAGPSGPPFVTTEINMPVGTAFGVKPGRVAWAFDPKATSWDGVTNAPGWWDDANTHPDVVAAMFSKVIRSVGDAASDKDAWNKIFVDFNKRHGKGEVAYKKGEKIAIKPNLNQCRSNGDNANASYVAPQLIQPLLRQLVNDVGVTASDITIYDAIRNIPSTIFDRVTREFPGVHFVDSTGAAGREKSAPDTTKPLVLSKGGNTFYFPTCLTAAEYLINIAGLKGHTLASMTVCAKNHQGTILTAQGSGGAPAMHASIAVKGAQAQTAGSYNGLVDMNGHPQTGGKTVLYIVDALYATQHNEFKLSTDCKWKSEPFNGNWTSSVFASQDGVAMDSVALDFLRSEPTIAPTVIGPVDNFLHEMALADKPPSKTVYDPAKTGKSLASMGVHEHWNNAAEKKYSRNLGKSEGIELVSVIV